MKQVGLHGKRDMIGQLLKLHGCIVSRGMSTPWN